MVVRLATLYIDNLSLTMFNFPRGHYKETYVAQWRQPIEYSCQCEVEELRMMGLMKFLFQRRIEILASD